MELQQGIYLQIPMSLFDFASLRSKYIYPETAKEDESWIYQFHNNLEDVETTKEYTAKPKKWFHN